MRRAAIALLTTLAAASASASERHFTYTYESAVLHPGGREFEPWSTFRLGKDGHFARLDTRLEAELGVTDRLQTSLYLNLSAPTQAWLARATATGTILDDDTVPTLTITPASVLEGDSGLSNAMFNVVLSAQSLTPVMVDYFTSDQTAHAGVDYVQTVGTLTFNPGDTNLPLPVPAVFTNLPPLPNVA